MTTSRSDLTGVLLKEAMRILREDAASLAELLLQRDILIGLTDREVEEMIEAKALHGNATRTEQLFEEITGYWAVGENPTDAQLKETMARSFAFLWLCEQVQSADWMKVQASVDIGYFIVSK